MVAVLTVSGKDLSHRFAEHLPVRGTGRYGLRTIREGICGMSDTKSSGASTSSDATQLEAIVDSAVDAIISIDGRGIIMRVNPAAEKLFGYPRDHFVGRNVKFLMPEPYYSQHDGYISAYHKTGRRKIIGIGREVIGLRGDGTTFPMQLAVSEYKVGEETHFTGIIHDLTMQRETEKALQQAQKRGQP